MVTSKSELRITPMPVRSKPCGTFAVRAVELVRPGPSQLVMRFASRPFCAVTMSA